MSEPARYDPLYDAYLYRGMRAVARGQIRFCITSGELTYRDQPVPGRLADAVRDLQEGHYIEWEVDCPVEGMFTADLTMTGTQLLVSWMTWAGHNPSAA